MPKRKKGEGSWGRKTIKGTEYKYYTKQYKGFNTPKYFYGLTETEINEKRKKFEENIEEELALSNRSKDSLIFGQYIESWLKREKKRELSEGTYDGYERAIRVRIKNLPEYDLYNKQMKQIDDKNVDVGKQIFSDYVDALVEHGYALKTIKEVCDIISQCLDYASNPIRKDLQYNYLKLVSMPNEEKVKKKRKEPHFMTETEMEILYNEAKRVNKKGDCKGGSGIGNPVYGNNAYAIIILQYTGLRIGELCALRWNDIDLEKKTMFIHHSLREVKNRKKVSKDDGLPSIVYIEKETKTKNGIRTLSITNRVMDALLYFMKYKTSDNDYVCVSTNHTHMRKEGIARTLTRMTKHAGLYPYSPHELRHSFGSILLEKSDNVDRAIGAISRILGHANITITYNIYIHILDSRLTTTFQMLDYDTIEAAYNEDDLDKDYTTSEHTATTENTDGEVDYKRKYEELLESIKSIKSLLPNIEGN